MSAAIRAVAVPPEDRSVARSACRSVSGTLRVPIGQWHAPRADRSVARSACRSVSGTLRVPIGQWHAPRADRSVARSACRSVSGTLRVPIGQWHAPRADRSVARSAAVDRYEGKYGSLLRTGNKRPSRARSWRNPRAALGAQAPTYGAPLYRSRHEHLSGSLLLSSGGVSAGSFAVFRRGGVGCSVGFAGPGSG